MPNDKDKGQPDFIPADAQDFIPAGGAAGGRLEPPPKSFNEQLTERRDWPTYDPQHPVASAGRAIGTGVGNFGAGTIKGIEGLAGIPHMVMHPWDTLTQDIPNTAIQMGRDIGEGHPEYALGELGGAYLGGKALGAIPGVPKVVERVGGKIGEATRLPPEMPSGPMEAVGKGELRPWTKATSQILGAGTGAVGGTLASSLIPGLPSEYGRLGGAYGGGALGYRLGPTLADAILPRNRTPIPEPPLARGEMYEDLAQRRVARGAEQAKLDTANEARLRETEDARQKQLANTERLREQEAQGIMRRGREQERIDRPAIEAETEARKPVPLSESPYATQAKARLVAEEEARKPVPLSQSPYATQAKVSRAFAEGQPGLFNRVSESPNRPQPGTIPPLPGQEATHGAIPPAGRMGAPDDLISRMKKIVVPGEEPTAEDLKRAGDLTQAPLPKLMQLKKFNDRLAINEINRRQRNQ